MRHRSFLVAGPLAALLALAAPRAADAQEIHWDAALHGGIARRALSSTPPGKASDATFGPAFELHGHLALLPLVRVGAYVSYDVSPIGGADLPARHFRGGGARVKVTSPWPRGDLRVWAFTGLGYQGVYAPSVHLRLASPTTGAVEDTFVDGATGSLFEVPLGIGAAYRLAKPWSLACEIGARFGFAFDGDAYGSRVGVRQSGARIELGSPGNDSFALFATIGLQWDK